MGTIADTPIDNSNEFLLLQKKEELEFLVLNAMELNRNAYFAGLEQFTAKDFSFSIENADGFDRLRALKPIITVCEPDTVMDYYIKNNCKGANEFYRVSTAAYDCAKYLVSEEWKDYFAELKEVNKTLNQ